MQWPHSGDDFFSLLMMFLTEFALRVLPVRRASLNSSSSFASDSLNFLGFT